MSAPICEIRTPTYNRPVLLERALRSLQAQTHGDWVCRVMDDSTNDAAAGVCAALKDPRILYVKNPVRLGARGNIDGCFARAGLSDSTHFFVLEDDNFVLPDFISDNLQAMQAAGAPVLLRNQRKEAYAPGDANGDLLDETCLAGQFNEGTLPPALARTGLLFGIGLSNGGLFWSAEAKSDFETRLESSNPALDEYLRAWLIRDRVHIAMEPLAIWRDNGLETNRAGGGGMGVFLRNQRALQRLRRAIYDNAVAAAGQEAVTGAHLATPAAEREAALARLVRAWPGEARLSFARRANLVAKGLLLSAAPGVPGIGRFMRERPLEG